MTTPELQHGGAPGQAAHEQHGRQHLITSFSPDLLDPDRTVDYISRYYALEEWEQYAERQAIHQEVGPERYTRGELPEGVNIVSYGAALQTGNGLGRRDPNTGRREPKPDYDCQDRLLFDASRGMGIIADGVGGEGGGAMAASIVTNAYYQDLSRENLSRVSNPSAAVNALSDSLHTADRALGAAKQFLPDAYEGSSAAATAFQLLPGGKLAFVHAGDTSLFVSEESGECEQITEDQCLPHNRSVITNYLDGNRSIEGKDRIRHDDQTGVIQLKPGRNIITMTTDGYTGDAESERLDMIDIEAAHIALQEQGLDFDDPQAASAIAEYMAKNRLKGRDDVGILVVIVNVEANIDNTADLPTKEYQTLEPAVPQPMAPELDGDRDTDQTRVFGSTESLRRHARPATDVGGSYERAGDEPAKKPWFEKIRPSTLVYSAMAKLSTMNRREMYQHRSAAGRLGRIGARIGDLAAWGYGLKLAYSGASAVANHYNVKLPDMPDIDFPNVNLPKIDMPDIDMPDINVPDINWPWENDGSKGPAGTEDKGPVPTPTPGPEVTQEPVASASASAEPKVTASVPQPETSQAAPDPNKSEPPAENKGPQLDYNKTSADIDSGESLPSVLASGGIKDPELQNKLMAHAREDLIKGGYAYSDKDNGGLGLRMPQGGEMPKGFFDLMNRHLDEMRRAGQV